MKRPLGAQISHMLKDRGVEIIFGIPGVHNVEMYRGIEEAGLTHVLARHEQGAGFMADGYARATGRPGVAYVITGPGLCNAMTPMGQAYSDSVPMLVISSCLDEVAARRGQLHQMKDQAGAAATVCDWSEEARSASAAYALIDRAFKEFTAARPRSKHVQIPITLASAVAEPAPPPPPAPAAPGAVPQAADLDAAAAALARAARPLVIFGGGARHARAEAAALLKRTGAASFVTYAGRGVVDPDAPAHFGSYLARGGSDAVVAQADVVLAVGTELSETDLWRDRLDIRGTFISLDIDPAVLAAQAAQIAVLGDAAAGLRGLAERLPGPGPASPPWDAAEVAATKSRWRAEVVAERPGIIPVADALRGALPLDTMIYSDMTQFAYAAKEVWDMAHPGHWHHPTGFGTLGYALPAAIGGKIGRGPAPVLAIAGDYGFQYTLQELGVAVELNLTLPIILWDNGKLKEIEDAMVHSQIAPNAVVAQNPDFCALAEAYGARAARPETLGALKNSVRAAFNAPGPTLIHVAAGIA
ncbi:MAG: 5-guanidino-2-oxopentanoate decarboxylase [Pseudomonadota bacterium]